MSTSAGELNSMGTLRLMFPNPYDVFMHDTPTKSVFGETFRFESSGCIRVHNVRELAAFRLAVTEEPQKALEAYRSDRFTGFVRQPTDGGVITGHHSPEAHGAHDVHHAHPTAGTYFIVGAILTVITIVEV